MMRSMTGVGLACSESGSFLGSVSVRSLNHRFLDVTIRSPRTVALIETSVREHVQGRLSRGRVEVHIRGEVTGGAPRPEVDSALATAYVEALRGLARANCLSADLSLGTLVQLPGVVGLSDAETAVSDAARQQVLQLVDQALDALDTMRAAEGEQLAAALERHLAAIESEVGRIEADVDVGRDARRVALQERGRSLCLDLGLDENRLYAEIARLVDRCDVAEELDRLLSHVRQARLHLARRGSGKTLDFLAQEMMREANTIGSKAVAAAVTHRVVGLKTEIERFREQVQNVE